MTKRPHSETTLAKFLTLQILSMKGKKSQIVIATEAGFVNPNMISMIKIGTSKLALDRVPSLATALECDPAYLMRLALDQAVGATASSALIQILGTPVTENERGWLEELRDVSKNSDPRMTGRGRTALRSVFGK